MSVNLAELNARIGGYNQDLADVEASLDFYLRTFAPIGIREAIRFPHGDSLVVGLSGPDGIPVAIPAPVQDSSMLMPLAHADCLLVREPLAPAARAGERCAIIRLAA